MANGVRYTPTFAMPSEYEQQAMEARRRRRMAEMLAAQAYQPQEGGVAPIPTAAPLVQGLQAFLTARQLRKAEEAEQKAAETESEYAKRLAGRLAGGYEYKPTAEDAETLKQREGEAPEAYRERMRTAQFTSPTFDEMLARTPEQTTLEQITPTARYKRSPEEALAMAETDVGMAAMKNRPVLAARLAQLLEKPESAEFGTSPQYDAEGRAYVINKAGEIKYLANVRKPEEAKAKPTSVQEYEYAKGQGFQGTLADWERQNRAAGAPRITIDKGGELAQELFLKDLGEQNKAVRGAEGIINKLDQMTASTAKGTFTGGLAPGAVGAAQFLQTFGINVDPNTVANTRAFQAASNQLVLDFMAANGGARGFTEKETAILQDAFPKIVDSPQARMQITKLLRDRAQETISNYNQTLDQYKSTYPSSVIPFRKVETEEERYQRWLREQGKPK
jgi:hypothetical protein